MQDERSPDGPVHSGPDVDVNAIDEITRDEVAASRKLAAIEAGRRKGGLVGAAMAGAMLTLKEIYEGPVTDDDIMIVSESTDKLRDIDTDGIDVTVGDVAVWAPPPHRTASGT